MKNILLIWMLRSHFSFVFNVVILFLISSNVYAVSSDNSNDERTNQKFENAVQKHQRLQANLEVADSLIIHGDTIRERTSIEIKVATDLMHERSRQYTAQRRNLERDLRNAQREELTETRLAIRNLDQNYREELNAYDEFMREVIRESEVGTRNYDHGKEIRREAQKGLREVAQLMAELRQEMLKNENQEEDVATH